MANYQNLARQAAQRHGLDPKIFTRQINAESGFNPNAKSPAGAQGIAQIMPATAKAWGVNPSDPVASLDAAAKNMASYVKKYGSYDAALRAYNAGPGNIEKSKGFAETNAYVKNILGGSNLQAKVGKALAPASPATPFSSGVDNKSLALSLLGFGSGGNDPTDPLTMALQGAQQSVKQTPQTPQTQAAPTANTGGKSTGGLVPQVVKALAFARAHGWKGQVNSGYRSDAEQLRIWNSGVRPAAKPKSLGGSGSNHSSGTAVDVSDVAGFARAMAQAPRSIRLYNKVANDELHFSTTGH